MQPIQQRQKTSVFSDYQNNPNTSVTSKQLQYWLMHMAPTSHASPKFNHNHNQDWNMMSTSSRYESDGMTFGQRIDTFESANKQNFMSRGNLLLVVDDMSKTKISTQNIQHYQSDKQQKMTKSKSYINAMQQLQKRAKTLEEQNTTMRKSLLLLQEQKRSSLQTSVAFQEEVKSQVSKFSQTEKKNQELKRQNKKLRDAKNEQSMKVKLMQKAINQQKLMVKQFEQRLNLLSKQNQFLKRDLQESNTMLKTLLLENKQLVIRTQTLENMKQKSTNSILEKYAKALQKIEELELNISEFKNKQNIIEQKHKRSIEEKDKKFMNLLETINAFKLQKQQLSMRLQNSLSEVEQKNKKLTNYQSVKRQIEHNNIQLNRKYQEMKIKFEDSENKNKRLSQKYQKLQIKYDSLKEQLKCLQQKVVEKQNAQKKNKKDNQQTKQNRNFEEQQNSIENRQNKTESDQSNQTQQRQESSPVQKYQQEQENLNRFQQDEYIKYTRPLSILKNVKNNEPKIADNDDESQKVAIFQQNQQKSQSSQEQSLSNQPQIFATKKILQNKKNDFNQTKNSQNRIRSIESKQSSKQKKSQKQNIKSQRKSNSKDSKNSHTNSITQKIKSPKQNNLKSKQQSTKRINKKQTSILNQSFTRSRSTSVQKKKSVERKSISVESKRSSTSKSINKQQPSSQSRLIQQKYPSNDETYFYQSAQQARYPHQSNEHYFYSGEINTRQPYLQEEIQPQSFHYTPAHQQQNTSNMMAQQSKNQLNKALLLEYQQQALKLYEQHQRLLEISQNQDISTEEKAQILGRIRQVMLMIDHNTEKIFSIKGNTQ